MQLKQQLTRLKWGLDAQKVIVGEINYFAWDKESGDVFFVFKGLEPDLEKPVYENAGGHVLQMKPQTYLWNLIICYYYFTQ